MHKIYFMKKIKTKKIYLRKKLLFRIKNRKRVKILPIIPVLFLLLAFVWQSAVAFK